MKNYLSLDFESWTYPDLPGFRNLKSEKRKKLDNGYVKDSAEQILSLLGKHGAKITFFVLAQLYEWYPETIEKIAEQGHEIAFHTYSHDILTSKKTLVDSLKNSRKFLKKFKPKGFRAPNILIKKEHFQILSDYGFKYDSSTCAPFSNVEKLNGVMELPVSKFYQIPIGLGYFIAILGKKISFFYRQVNKNKDPFICFIHNWQIIKPKEATFPNFNYLFKRPYYFPYTLEIKEVFEYLLGKFSFEPMEKLI